MEEDRGIEGGVEGSAWDYFVVKDSVGHCLLVGVCKVTGG